MSGSALTKETTKKLTSPGAHSQVQAYFIRVHLLLEGQDEVIDSKFASLFAGALRSNKTFETDL